MRTTIDFPVEMHQLITSIARDTSRSLSETVTELVRRALGVTASGGIHRSPRTGLPVVSVNRVITTEDVRALEDDE